MSLVLRAAAGYLILLFAVRLIGRRTASQMAPFDLVLLFLFGGITITAVIGDDRSLTGAVSAVFTIGLMHILVSWAKSRYPLVGRIVDGKPVVVYEHGQWHRHRMHRLRLNEQDIMAAARQRGLERLEQVRYATAERDGKISIIAEGGD
ncbi:DUF421 domain-containing protein [Pararoseomonas indoligenes]|uniref:DUF421 domain-containing protein n=1 Tax=Roseomonas indoligenes TaxID=2820811 RepID=A0A940N017_9PROT|nr:YetF domain-containing protein [Pararoseomonas indoligenes]MBP0494205.1 DUF421 domain-containing protein [Pararoseomonas indoligenes]